METIKINQLEIENVKRVKAVRITPTQEGLTVIGGKNSQGKTSVLDSIAWALGGDKFRPSQPAREGSITPPYLHVELSNGLIVERKGNNSSLKVIDMNGNKGGQQLLNEFIEQLALDLPKFLNQSSKEKAATLLKIIGVGDELYKLETQEQQLYNKRHTIGQIADQKAKFAKEMDFYPDAPEDLVSITELIIRQQNILAKNGENARKRAEKEKYERKLAEAQAAFKEAAERLKIADENYIAACKSAEDLVDESTAEIEKSIADIEIINAKVRTNLERERATEEANKYAAEYDDLTEQIEAVRQQKTNLLDSADLPLPGLSVENGELIYNGYKWDNMSSSEQLRVATAIVRKLNPKCGFVLLDKLEQMDSDTLSEFGKWLEGEGLQAIATRVGTGDECSIVIEDGYIKETTYVKETTPNKTWKAGEF